MFKFKDISIQKKLALVIVFVSATILFLTSVINIINNYISFRRDLVHNLSSIAQITAKNTSAAIVFDDPTAAEEILAALKYKPHIVGAFLYRTDGKLFAKYVRKGDREYMEYKEYNLPLENTINHRFKDNYLELFSSVVLKNEAVGKILIVSDLQEEADRIKQFALISFLILFGSIGIAILIAFFVAKPISDPILQLKSMAQKIAKGELSQRIDVQSKDEIGELGGSFNEMAENLKTSRDELVSAKDYTDNIIRSMIDTLVVVDPEAKIKSVNQATCDLFGCTEEELIGSDVSSLFAEEEKKEKDLFKGTRFERLIKEGSARDYDMTYKTKSGEKIPVSFSGSVIRDKEGKLVGFVGVARDMREIKRLMQKEKDLAVVAAEAEAEKQRANELKKAKDEIEKKNKELRKLDELKSELIANVSHELRTPLTIIKESISLVADGITGETTEIQKKIMSRGLENISRLQIIIENLLDISRLESRMDKLKKTQVDIVALVKEVRASLLFQANKKDLEVRLNFPHEVLEIYIDKDKIIQVFTNLIGNAIKFTEKGYIEVLVIDKKNSVECCVSDTGIGIGEEDLPKVFSKFQQFGRTYGPGAKGTGLGLSISKSIVELHQGKIRVESKINKGAKFIFSLPKNTAK